jgi:Tol biopolymer transport system component/tRNA A-37 threonylcarbamoyl transferase component Bud32
MTEPVARLQNALADRYRIARELGQGGMATVYLAEDLKHDRKVAIKVLRPELAAIIGAERFLREIKTIATLQHPHILGLIDSGEADGTAYYVMPYVEGESLRDRLEREKQLPIPDAIRLATEVASALDYAHRHGVIHRDIKPENILLHDGSALVADFGIALAVASAGSVRMTETGMSLGTPRYMSPEQAMGEREITARSDIYALGCVTYEMLSGDPPFTGSTAQAIIAKVMTEKPASLQKQRERVSDEVEDAVFTALEKLPADRYASAAQFAEALRGAPGTSGTRQSASRARVGANSSRNWRARLHDPVVLTLAAMAIAGVAFALWSRSRSPSAHADVVRFTLPTTPGDRTSSIGYPVLAVSPDGRMLVYVGKLAGGHDQLVIRPLDDATARPLPGTEDGVYPVFSPDGKWVAFMRANQLYRIAVNGAAPQLIGTAPGTFNGASWSASGVIIMSGNTALFTIPEAGGPVRRFADGKRPAGEILRDAPLVVDDAHVVIYSSWTAGSPASASIAIVPIGGGDATALDIKGIQPLGVVNGTLVYVTATGLMMGVPIDIGKRRLLGPPVQLIDDVSLNLGTGLAHAALSRSGTLLYQTGTQMSRVVIAGTDGRTRVLLDESRDYAFPRLSPNAQQLAITVGAADHRDIWLDELASGTRTRLTTEGLTNERPEWSPDGRHVLYRTDRGNRSGIWWRPSDLSAESTPLVTGERIDVFEAVISPDSRYVAYQVDTLGADIYYRALSGDTTPRPIANNPAAIETMPRISPDGHWIAFVTNESGRDEVVVQPFPGPGGRVQVSAGGGAEPVWSRDGRRLFYRGDARLMAATIHATPAFTVVARDTVLADTYVRSSNPHANYDVLPDGTHFVFLQPDNQGELMVVANWESVLQARMAGQGEH